MSDKTAIEWTEATWNPVRGCTRVSPGCGGPGKRGGCYAEKIASRFSDLGSPYHGFAERGRGGSKWTGKVALIEDMLTVPMHWKKPRRIFVNSMSDLFHEALPDEAIDRVFAVMALCPQHTFQVLTKRPVRMWDYCSGLRVGAWRKAIRAIAPDREPSLITDPLPNVWLGVSAERQQEWDERTEHLRNTPAAVRFVSLEPLLGGINMRLCATALGFPAHIDRDGNAHGMPHWLHWVIAGGESGPNARPMNPAWTRSLREQCKAADVPFFFKQWGEFLPVGEHLPGFGKIHGATAVKPGRMKLHYAGTPKQAPKHAFAETGVAFTSTADGRLTFRVGKKRAGRLLDGVEHNAFPGAAA